MAAYQRNAMANGPLGDYCDIYGNDSDNFYVDKHAEIKAVQQSTGYRYLLDKWDGISSSLEKARRDGSMLAGVGLMAYDFADGVVGLGRWVAGKFGANTGEHVFKYLDDAHRQQATIGGAMTGILSGIAGIAKNVAKVGAGIVKDAGRPIIVSTNGVALTPELLAQQGTSHLIGEFTGLRGAKVEEIFSRVPSNWKVLEQKDGLGFRFLDEAGFERLRLHGPSAKAPVGSNANSGWIIRIVDRSGNYYDDAGQIVSKWANEGHIPIYGNPVLR
jgi:hypothetical protein